MSSRVQCSASFVYIKFENIYEFIRNIVLQRFWGEIRKYRATQFNYLEPFTMMLEYYNMPDKTLETYRNLWFHSGDLATRDADGYFYFVDRKKDALRRRGENISSFEVERAINTHPSVLESAAVAVKSELAEDEVKICVVLKPGATLSPEELIGHAADRMPYFAVPRFVEFMDALPKTPTERVQKYLLKQAGVTPNTWDREKAGIEVSR